MLPPAARPHDLRRADEMSDDLAVGSTRDRRGKALTTPLQMARGARRSAPVASAPARGCSRAPSARRGAREITRVARRSPRHALVG